MLLLARGIIVLGRIIINKLNSYFPRRVSIIVGAVITFALIFSIANGVIVEYSFRVLDSSFQRFDALIEPDRPQLLIAERAGSPASKLDWRKLGRAGREFVASGPTASDIRDFNKRSALEHIRLYAGLQVADTPNQRAHLLLTELIRTGAFDRAALVVIAPRGTGWIDPPAIDGLEFLFDGDVASVALQYSYLNSPLPLLFQPDNGLASSQALFRAVYDHWKKLPVDQRPELYLRGLSLGAFNSQRSLTNNRDAGSTEWLPVFQDGRFVRFMVFGIGTHIDDDHDNCFYPCR